MLKRLKEGVYGDIYDPVKEYNKLTDDIEVKDDMIENEDDMIEYVEGYEELEEEDDIEDFGGLALEQGAADDDYGIILPHLSLTIIISLLPWLVLFLNWRFNVTDGSDEECELTVAINRKREKKDSAFGRKRLDKDGFNVESKKKSRVLVEVNTYYTSSHFGQTPSIALRSHL